MGILNAEDIEGLLESGAPPDEYAGEAARIAAALAQGSWAEITEEHIAGIVRRVWSEQFGPFSREDLQMRSNAFLAVARQILATRSTK